jgi:glycosyltransferase involved in cell wall biosynthesis
MSAGSPPDLRGRLLLVHGSADPGGTELQTLRLAQFLRDRGVDVASLFDCADGPIIEQHRQQGFPVHRDGVGLYPARETREWVRRLAPHAFYLFGMRSNVRWRVWTRQLCPSARVWGAIRGLTSAERVRVHRVLLDRVTVGLLDGYVSNSRYVIERLVRWGFPAAKLHFLRSFLEFEEHTAQSRPTTVERLLLPGPPVVLPARVPVLTYVANVRPVKGHRLLIPVLKRLRNSGVAFRCLFVGAPPADVTLIRQIREAGLQDEVVFAGFRSDRRAILARSDLLVFPSLMEGCPNAVLEAMQARLPIVASPWGEQRYLIEEGLGGFLADPHDADAFAAHIFRLLAEPHLRARFGAHNSRRVREIFDPIAVETEAVALVSRMLEGAHAVGAAPP